MADSDLVDRLSRHRTIGAAPREELAWLAAHGRPYRLELGNLLKQRPDLMQMLAIILSGHFAIYIDHGAGPHKVTEWRGGDVAGLLPYSRMSTTPLGEIVVDEVSDALVVHRDEFPALIRGCPAVTTALVHVMVDRARLFRASELHDEKMISLGRLAAGLAHELNNPASAADRSARLLADSLAEAEESSFALGAAGLTSAQVAAVEAARSTCVAMPPAALSPLERADREEAVADWLDRHGIDAAAAGPLADTAVTLETLDGLAPLLDGDALTAAVRRVAAGCTTRALAADVSRASSRVHDLVAAIKRFTYMDRAQVSEPIDLAQSVSDSVSLLLHKARKKSIGLAIELEPDLPKVNAIGGDLNQVWLNLIDNALDAVGESGRVTVSAARRPNSVTVRIVDNGPGVPAAVRDTLFDPFVTTKPVGHGTGLGLDIARQLVRRNNGDIEFDSEPGRTEFRVTMPRAEDVPAASARSV